MKISVLGNIIDTENIYKITPIELIENPYDREFYYTFNICFYNSKSITINIFPDVNWYPENWCKLENRGETVIKEYKDDNKHLPFLEKITKLREEVIKYWSNNQSQIPKIEFI